jgi:hypothetical protein
VANCILGNDGVVQVGTDVVAGVTAFSVTEEVTEIDCTAMGDTGRVTRPGRVSWSAEVTCYYDPTSTAQQALAVGEIVTLSLYPAGDATGSQKLVGEAMVSGVGTEAQLDNNVELKITVQGRGALERVTV